MTVYYLDASAWVKRYAQEVGTTWLRAFLGERHATACSTLGLVEVTATLSRQHKTGQLTTELFRQKIGDLDNDWAAMIRVDVTDEVVKRSRSVTQALATRGADSVHLATAQLLADGIKAQNEQLVLIASDRELLAAARASGLTALDPVEEERMTAP